MAFGHLAMTSGVWSRMFDDNTMMAGKVSSERKTTSDPGLWNYIYEWDNLMSAVGRFRSEGAAREQRRLVASK